MSKLINKLKNRRYCVFDLETTGLHLKQYKQGSRDAHIIQIGACILENGEIIDEFDTFVDPGIEISDEITGITGITQGMVEGAPDEVSALKEFLKFSKGAILVAHNLNFDFGFLNVVNTYLGPIEGFDMYCGKLDTLALDRLIYPNENKHSLDAAVERLNIPKNIENIYRNNLKITEKAINNFFGDKHTEDEKLLIDSFDGKKEDVLELWKNKDFNSLDKISPIMEYLKIQFRHTALYDAKMTSYVLLHYIEKAPKIVNNFF